MIHVLLRGDFGNQLFQYALARKLALIHNTGITFNLTNRATLSDPLGRRVRKRLDDLGLPVSYSVIPVCKYRVYDYLGLNNLAGIRQCYRESGWGFYAEVLELPDDSCLYGYFQSAKYFQDIELLLRKDLCRENQTDDPAYVALKDDILGSNSVSIHVRRGDYLDSPYLNICTGQYYQRAIQYLSARVENARFYLFSDDIEWCKQNVPLPDGVYVDFHSMGDAHIIDFELMRLCRHNILSNSTYSWWPAWLNEYASKICVAPYRWFNDTAMNELALRDTIPAEWVRLEF